MSGIAGIFNLDGRPVDPTDLQRMVDKMAHRGPDGIDIWYEGNVGLGHCALHTTPESLHEKFPMTSRCGNFVLTADARIDNRDELISILRPPRYNGHPITDGELILQAYEKWGEDCPSRLVGDFAFAIWDSREEKLFCARDHFGIRPLYYYHQPGRRFVFGSEIKAILATGDVPVEINEQAIAWHLRVPIEPTGEDTFYCQIHLLGPAQQITVERNRIRKTRYWQLELDAELNLSNPQDYVDGFRHHFFEAMRARLRTTTPVGITLSGGMDSSSITCTAAKLRGGGTDLHTFSALYADVAQTDERRYVDAVLSHTGATGHRFFADRINPLKDWRQVAEALDGIHFAANLYINWNAYREASKGGIRVVLEGFDGDSVVSHGYGYLSQLAHEQKWLRLAKLSRSLAKTAGKPWLPEVWSWWWPFWLSAYVQRGGVYRGLRYVNQAIGSLSRSAPPMEPLNRTWRDGLNPDFVKKVHLARKGKGFRATEREHQLMLIDRSVKSAAAASLSTCAAAFSVETRFPFFDKRLVEYCVSLPPDQKIGGGMTRLVLRRAMEGILPSEIQNRTDKSNLEPGFAKAFWTFEHWRALNLVKEVSEHVADYVDADNLLRITRKFVDEEASQSEKLLVWNSLVLGLWLQQVRNPTQRPSAVQETELYHETLEVPGYH